MKMLAFQNNGADPAALIGVILFLILLFFGLAFYFLPTIVAVVGKHRQAAAIFVLNLLAGWTFIGWVVAMVWAFIESRPEPVYVVQTPPPPPPPQPVRRPDYNYKKI